MFSFWQSSRENMDHQHCHFGEKDNRTSFLTILCVCRRWCWYLRVARHCSHGEMCSSIWVWKIKLNKTRRPRKQPLVSESGIWFWWIGQREHSKADIPLAYNVFEIWCGEGKRNSTPMTYWTCHFRERRESMVALCLNFEENRSSVFWNNRIYLQRDVVPYVEAYLIPVHICIQTLAEGQREHVSYKIRFREKYQSIQVSIWSDEVHLQNSMHLFEQSRRARPWSLLPNIWVERFELYRAKRTYKPSLRLLGTRVIQVPFLNIDLSVEKYIYV